MLLGLTSLTLSQKCAGCGLCQSFLFKRKNGWIQGPPAFIRLLFAPLNGGEEEKKKRKITFRGKTTYKQTISNNSPTQ